MQIRVLVGADLAARQDRPAVRLSIGIGPGIFGRGLSIAHAGAINFDQAARVGQNCRIHEKVTIGASGGTDAPVIGDNVSLALGCKVMGRVNVAGGCVVGANAVDVTDVGEPGITVAGVPAKKISDHNSDRFVFWYQN